jgi:uncharacterized protein (DUF433 family)
MKDAHSREGMEQTVDEQQVDWRQCAVVEIVPGKVSGAPVLVGTRMPVQTIVDNFDAGMSPDEIAEAWELERSDVDAVLAYREERCARSFREQAASESSIRKSE